MIDRHTFNGRPVKISQAFPRMQCSPEFVRLQSPELVHETNEWMAQFFGFEEAIPDGTVYELFGNTLVMNQRTFEQMKKASQS